MSKSVDVSSLVNLYFVEIKNINQLFVLNIFILAQICITRFECRKKETCRRHNNCDIDDIRWHCDINRLNLYSIAIFTRSRGSLWFY